MHNEDSVKETWNAAAPAWMDFVCTGKDYTRDGLNMVRLSVPFDTITFHRTLTDYFKALHRNHLYVSELVEPQLSEAAAEAYPSLQDARQRPQSVVIEAVKGPF